METKEISAMTRQERCLYCHRFMGKKHDESHCVAGGWEDEKVRIVSAEECDSCERFDSRYIEYPLTIMGIDNQKIDTSGLGHVCGELCEVTLAGKDTGEKSYLGIYLGDLPIAIHTSYNRDSGILSNSTMTNPAIYVFELRKIVYGCESWWRTIKSVDDFSGISKEDIDGTWYVQLLREMQKDEESRLSEAVRSAGWHGWKLKTTECTLNDNGNLEFVDKGGTHWEVDPSDGKSRHRGDGTGCFWTEWE